MPSALHPTTRLRALWLLLGLALVAYVATAPYRSGLRRQSRERQALLLDPGAPLTPASERAVREEIARLETAGAGPPGDVARWVRLSALYTRLGRYSEALRCLRAATEADPRSLELRLALADVYESTGYYDRALEVMQPLLPEHGSRSELLLRLGQLYTTIGWHQEATPLLRRAVALAPRSPEARLALGLSHAHRVHFAAALEELRTAARLAPDDPRPLYEIARIRLDASEPDAARATVEAALRRHPGDAAFHLLLGKLRMREPTPENLAAAREAFTRVLGQNSAAPAAVRLEARYRLGLCSLLQGDTARAIADLEQVARHSLEFEAVALKLGQLYLRAGQKREGERLLAAYEAIMRRGDAQKRLMLRVAMRPGDPEAHLALGEFLVHSAGDFRRGITEQKRAVALRPGDPRLRHSLREGLRRAGRAHEAG